MEAPFRRLLRMMEEGYIDIMLGPLKTSEREKVMAFVAPVFRRNGNCSSITVRKTV